MKKNIPNSRSAGDVEVVTQSRTRLNHVIVHVVVSKTPAVILIYDDISCVDVKYNDIMCNIAIDCSGWYHILRYDAK